SDDVRRRLFGRLQLGAEGRTATDPPILPGLEVVEQSRDSVDIAVAIVDGIERRRQADGVPGIISLIKLLAAGERGNRGIEGEAEQLDARAGVRVRGLEILLDVLPDRTRCLG